MIECNYNKKLYQIKNFDGYVLQIHVLAVLLSNRIYFISEYLYCSGKRIYLHKFYTHYTPSRTQMEL
jgi:hypothetical protein